MVKIPRVLPRRSSTNEKDMFRGSTNGLTPFYRHMFMIGALIAISFALSVIVSMVTTVYPPLGDGVDKDMLLWVLCVPVMMFTSIYVLSVVVSTYILTQAPWGYCLWLIKDGAGNIIRGYGVALSISLLLIGGTVVSLPDNSWIINETFNITTEERSTMLAVSFCCVLIAWWGYRTAWKVVRFLGAQTMQMRYESDITRMETINSGQWWDRNISMRMSEFLGADGSKPRIAVVYHMLGMTFVIAFIVLSLLFRVPALHVWSLVFVPCSLISLWSAVSKYRDGRRSSKHGPRLTPIRDHTTPDEYNPEKIGVRAFVR